MTIEECQQGLRSPDLETRVAAAEALMLMGPDASPMAVELVQATSDSEEQVSEFAVAALEELGPPPTNSLGPLTELLGDPHLPRPYWAAKLIGRMGKDGASAEVDLVQLLESNQEAAAQQEAIRTLQKIGAHSSQCRATLERATQTQDPRTARLATQTLSNMT